MAVAAQDHTAFDLIPNGDGWTFRASPGEPGEYQVTIAATPPGASSPQTWQVSLYASQAVEVSERSVAAINRAIRAAPVADGYETVILLPSGYIPMDYNTPVILDRTVTLRGRDTVLASEVVVMCQSPGAKLQDLTIRFDDASFCDYTTRFTHLYLFPGTGGNGSLMSNTPYNAVYGNGIITLEDCVLDAGTGRVPPRTGVGVQGSRVSFRGANTIRGFAAAGFIVESTPGPRRYFRGLTLENNRYAVDIIENGSIDPYFIRLTESNFIDNHKNVLCAFPVNFAHNYFDGGNDDEHIVKSPQYTARLDRDNPDYPPLFIEEDRLHSAELLNFEGQTPISTDNFSAEGGAVRIAVRELDGSGVSEGDTSTVLLRWSFATGEDGSAPLFLPSAYINEALSLPPDSGIERYQGVRFAHHGPLPLEGAEISVRKEVLFQEETLHLYRLADGVLTYLGEVDNTQDEFYTFFLDRCSDYIITNVVVEDAGGNSGAGGGNSGGASANSSPGQNGTTGPLLPQSGDIRPDDAGQANSARAPVSPVDVPGDSMAAPGPEAPPPAGRADAQAPITAYDYSAIPAPAYQPASARGLSVNEYVDEATVRAAFATPRDGQVVIDVGVRTVVSPLAFQLLAENPSLDLVLKGDGYEWRFAGGDVSADMTHSRFDTAVEWRTDTDNGYARLDFAQQQALPGSCALVLENAAAPRDWAMYDARQARYLPCALDARQRGRRLTLHLDTPETFVAIL